MVRTHQSDSMEMRTRGRPRRVSAVDRTAAPGRTRKSRLADGEEEMSWPCGAIPRVGPDRHTISIDFAVARCRSNLG
jgi:hypothetical protein